MVTISDSPAPSLYFLLFRVCCHSLLCSALVLEPHPPQAEGKREEHGSALTAFLGPGSLFLRGWLGGMGRICCCWAFQAQLAAFRGAPLFLSGAKLGL